MLVLSFNSSMQVLILGSQAMPWLAAWDRLISLKFVTNLALNIAPWSLRALSDHRSYFKQSGGSQITFYRDWKLVDRYLGGCDYRISGVNISFRLNNSAGQNPPSHQLAHLNIYPCILLWEDTHFKASKTYPTKPSGENQTWFSQSKFGCTWTCEDERLWAESWTGGLLHTISWSLGTRWKHWLASLWHVPPACQHWQPCHLLQGTQMKAATLFTWALSMVSIPSPSALQREPKSLDSVLEARECYACNMVYTEADLR